MDQSLTVDVVKLRMVAGIVLDELERVHGPQISLDKDFFWSVPERQRVDVYEQPSDFTVGQNSEILEALVGLLEDSSRVTNMHSVWVGQLLIAIGHLAPD